MPDHLKERVGLLEVRRSLGNLSASRARQLAPVLAARLRETFDVLERTSLSKADCRKLIQNCFHDLSRETDFGFIPSAGDCQEIEEQRGLAKEFIAAIEQQVANHSFDTDIGYRAATALATRGVELDKLRGDVALDLVSGVARALAEQQRLFLHRLEDRLASYVATDPLFGTVGPICALPNTDPAPSPSLSELTALYLKEKGASWTLKTQVSNKAKLRYLVDYVGPDVPVGSVTPQQVRAFRDAIREMKIERARTRDLTVQGRVAATGQTIDVRTATLIFECAKAFFRWAAEEVHIPSNPAKEIAVKKGEKPRTRPRRPFATNEIERLFSAPNFAGFKSRSQRFKAGGLKVDDAYFWIPILGFFTGARLGELVQLHMSDVHLDGPIPFIDINENGAQPDTGAQKRVKSAAGIRKVPLHPDLLTLGFAEFVARRKKDPRARPRLFWEVPFGADGQASTVFSKWFGRLLQSVGLSDSSLVFHSFRHGAQDAFKNAETLQYVTDQIIGHADGKVSSSYGQGVSLEVLYKAVRQAKFDPTVLKTLKETGGAK